MYLISTHLSGRFFRLEECVSENPTNGEIEHDARDSKISCLSKRVRTRARARANISKPDVNPSMTDNEQATFN